MLKLSIFFMLMLVTELYADVIKLNPQAMTDAHNELRKKYNSPPLSYSNSLQAVAEKWAKTLQREGCRMRHSMGETGENIYWASPHTTIKTDGNNIKTRSSRLQNITDKNVVQSWYDEVKWYDYDTNRCKKEKCVGIIRKLFGTRLNNSAVLL
ncbi:CAP domain-containing protein [sulfur-oxidizing endosymbiont of Gigantopelta aegis]|uniref:CAP domain-containing protein n=1 Tax=sulfur-oxidizing endosymbiont of Gigantopelta aegis TaxID=2794934 RepID=UPI0018DCEF1D